MREPFVFCLNTSTLKGQRLAVVEAAELAAKAGYGAIEPWIRELDEHVRAGGTLKDLGKRIADLGLSVESAVGFFEWVLDDPVRRPAAFEEARRNFEQLQALGGKRIACPPWGHQREKGLDLYRCAESYRRLCELGAQFGVVPMVEFWGFSASLSQLGEALLVAANAAHPNACVLGDVYHMYKGGSGYEALKLLGPRTMPVLHMNDVPAGRSREELTDADRVWPGEGIAPMTQILADLRASGAQTVLSLELFNEAYWKLDALACAKTGLERMRALAAR